MFSIQLYFSGLIPEEIKSTVSMEIKHGCLIEKDPVEGEGLLTGHRDLGPGAET